jgi:hypothetical protein
MKHVPARIVPQETGAEVAPSVVTAIAVLAVTRHLSTKKRDLFSGARFFVP